MSAYICLRGDCDNFAFSRDDCFVVQDELGRDWFCYETDDVMSEIDSAKRVVTQMQAKAHSLGFATGGTSLSAVVDLDRYVLPAWLAET